MPGTIDNLTSPLTLGPFGELNTAYFAQSFKALGDHMQSLDLRIDGAGPGPTKFSVLITTVKTDMTGIHPDQVLKEVSGFVVPSDVDADFTTVHVNLDGVNLVKGQTYAFVLDAFVARDGTLDAATVGANATTYSDGFLFYYPVTTGARSDHFNADWSDGLGSLAFKAVFSDPGNTIIGGNKFDTISDTQSPIGQPKATAFDDTIFGNGGKDHCYGGDGFDTINGGARKDFLYGGNDGDDLNGGIGAKGKGFGHDKLFGGTGEDSFLFEFKMTAKSSAKNSDTIGDYSKAEGDAIYLKQAVFSALALGDLDNTAGHITFKNSSLYYDDHKFVKFVGTVPAAIADIHMVVYA